MFDKSRSTLVLSAVMLMMPPYVLHRLQSTIHLRASVHILFRLEYYSLCLSWRESVKVNGCVEENKPNIKGDERCFGMQVKNKII